jgi:predicted nucleic acid-binding protein
MTVSFIDTNILVYAHDATADLKRDIASQLLYDQWELETGRLSIQVLQEFFVTITQKVPEPLPVPEAALLIRELSHWPVHEPTSSDVLAAIDVQVRWQTSFWDAMILRSADVSGADVIYSEDLNTGQFYGRVRVINPFVENP